MSGDSPPVDRRSNRTRRQVLGGLLAGGAIALAGCLGDDDDARDENDNDDDGDEGVEDDDFSLNGRRLSRGLPVQLFDPDTDQLVTEVHYHVQEEFRHWHRVPVEVPSGGTKTAIAEVVDEDQELIPLGEDEEFRLEMRPTDETPDDRVAVDISGDVVRLYGESPGEARLLVEIVRNDDDEVPWQSPELWVEVVE